MNPEKPCLACGEPVKGRADKKFCDDLCRSNYNNKLNSDSTAEIRNINNILRRNRRILDSLVKNDGKTRVLQMNLADRGFNFRFYTHTRLNPLGNEFRLCYDYGYMLENDQVLVVKWESE